MSESDRTIDRDGIVSGVFQDVGVAEKAFAEARDLGYDDDEITVLMSEQARNDYFPEERIEVETERRTAEGAGVGGSIGLAVGAVAGAIAAIGTTILIPGLGLVVAGPLAGALAGAGAAGATGTLVGGLVGAGMSEERAVVYRTAIERGGIVLVVRPRSPEDGDVIEDRWTDVGGEEVFRG